LLDDYWERLNIKVPIYFSAGKTLYKLYSLDLKYFGVFTGSVIIVQFFEGLTIQANMYYKMLIGWTSQKIKESCTVHNPFDFKHGMDAYPLF
jgi:integrator complex subunit 11